MTTAKGLRFDVSNHHAGLKVLALGGLYAALTLGFVASVESTARRPANQVTVVSAPSPTGAAVAAR